MAKKVVDGKGDTNPKEKVEATKVESSKKKRSKVKVTYIKVGTGSLTFKGKEYKPGDKLPISKIEEIPSGFHDVVQLKK